jgi:hypothetical protein
MLDEREKQPEVERSYWEEKSQQQQQQRTTIFDFTSPPALAAEDGEQGPSESSSLAGGESDPIIKIPNLVDQPTALRSGRWGNDEKLLFLYGLKRFGKGRWKKMSVFLPHRYVCLCLCEH